MAIKTMIGAAVAFAAFTATPAAAVTFTGATTLSSPTYNRTLTGIPPTGLSSVGTAVHYQTTSFSVSTSGSYTFLLSAVSPVAWDTFLTLYSGSFNPLAPLTNALAANDDLNNTTTNIGLSGFTLNLTAGTSYFAVTTGFANTDVGSYTLAINPVVAAIPEPATWAMLIVGFGAVGGAMRRRSVVRTTVRYC